MASEQGYKYYSKEEMDELLDFKTVLYDGGTTGTNGTVTLSEDVSNFVRLKIFFRGNDNNQNFTEVMVDKLSSSVTLAVPYVTSSGRWDKIKLVTISGTSITNGNYQETQFWGAYSSANNVYITRVEGWKI